MMWLPFCRYIEAALDGQVVALRGAAGETMSFAEAPMSLDLSRAFSTAASASIRTDGSCCRVANRWSVRIIASSTRRSICWWVVVEIDRQLDL